MREGLTYFSGGCFQSTTRKAKLVQLEEALLDSDMETEDASTLFRTISGIVHHAARLRHGCAIVVSSDSPVSVMMGGIVLDAKWRLKPSNFCNAPVLLKKWVATSDSAYY